MENWFATWFNSPYYHILYKDRSYQEAEAFIDTLVEYLNMPKGSRALDLACGKGRHSVQLNIRGFEVVGIDLSEESIAEAKLREKDGLEFFEHDMRELYWTEHFDLVANLFTSFGYFHDAEDDQRTISSVADALKPDGVFVLDFLNAVKVENNLVHFEEKIIDGVKFELNRSVEEGAIVKRIHIVDGEIELDFEERVDGLKLKDFANYLQEAGLEVETTFGDYNLNTFDETSSDRLIIIAKKMES